MKKRELKKGELTTYSIDMITSDVSWLIHCQCSHFSTFFSDDQRIRGIQEERNDCCLVYCGLVCVINPWANCQHRGFQWGHCCLLTNITAGNIYYLGTPTNMCLLPWHDCWFNLQDENEDLANSKDEASLLSFSSSAFPHYAPRKYTTYDDLRQLYRSVGCVSDEIRVECLQDSDSMVVIENATFYAVPDDNWLNCTRGPVGPLAMGGLMETGASTGLQHSIFAGVSGFSSLTTVR